MNTNRKNIMMAGFVYLIVIITGIFSIGYVPKKLIDWNDSTNTFQNIRESIFLFKFSIFINVICYLAFSFLPLLLYRILHNVNEFYARAMVVLALISVPSSISNLQNKYAIARIIDNGTSLEGHTFNEMPGKIMYALYQYTDGLLLITVFWGLWLFPLGLLVYKSGFLPKFLGILLMLGCIGYLANYSGNTLIENYSNIGIGKYISMVPAIAEISTCFWLLLFSIKTKSNGN